MARQGRRRAGILAMALIGARCATPTHAHDTKIDEHFLLLMGARNAVKAGKHETAIARYHKLLARIPHCTMPGGSWDGS